MNKRPEPPDKRTRAFLKIKEAMALLREAGYMDGNAALNQLVRAMLTLNKDITRNPDNR
jgi:hypothetical protein